MNVSGCVRRWQESPSYFLSARAPPPPPCRLPPSVMWPHLPLPPAQGGRGEPSPWTGWNPKEQFSRPPSRGKLKENLWNKTRLARRGTGTGREDSSSTGSPPPPSPPPPPSQSPTRFQAHSAHRPAETHVHRFEPKNLEYFPPRSICLTDVFVTFHFHTSINIQQHKYVQTKYRNKKFQFKAQFLAMVVK